MRFLLGRKYIIAEDFESRLFYKGKERNVLIYSGKFLGETKKNLKICHFKDESGKSILLFLNEASKYLYLKKFLKINPWPTERELKFIDRMVECGKLDNYVKSLEKRKNWDGMNKDIIIQTAKKKLSAVKSLEILKEYWKDAIYI